MSIDVIRIIFTRLSSKVIVCFFAGLKRSKAQDLSTCGSYPAIGETDFTLVGLSKEWTTRPLPN
jgi:hypothetical protein